MKLNNLTDTRIMADTTSLFLARCLNQVNNKPATTFNFKIKI